MTYGNPYHFSKITDHLLLSPSGRQFTCWGCERRLWNSLDFRSFAILTLQIVSFILKDFPVVKARGPFGHHTIPPMHSKTSRNMRNKDNRCDDMQHIWTHLSAYFIDISIMGSIYEIISFDDNWYNELLNNQSALRIYATMLFRVIIRKCSIKVVSVAPAGVNFTICFLSFFGIWCLFVQFMK